ncbi:hypothetical protein C8Q79DRAFT_471902 [Trametes meyenii]|nr:hypothetical protein C8Q79DRAFT_471902 [Trametes meyenii]
MNFALLNTLGTGLYSIRKRITFGINRSNQCSATSRSRQRSPRLNSRTLLVGRRVEIFDSASTDRKVIARMHRPAQVQRWNVPHLPDAEPAVIDIKVASEMETQSYGSGEQYELNKGPCIFRLNTSFLVGPPVPSSPNLPFYQLVYC